MCQIFVFVLSSILRKISSVFDLTNKKFFIQRFGWDPVSMGYKL